MFVVWATIYSYSVVCEVPCHAIMNQRLSCLLYGQFLTPLEPIKKLAYQNDPFIMAEQAKQAFYVQDPCDERWSVVLHGKTIGVNVEDDDSYIHTYVTPLSTQMWPNIVGEEEAGNVHANRNDHDEGELINIA